MFEISLIVKSIARREYLIYESYDFKKEIWDINILNVKGSSHLTKKEKRI